MSRVRPHTTDRRWNGAMRALLMTASLAALVHALPAAAQQVEELRGAVEEADVTDSLLAEQVTTDPITTDPITTGATPAPAEDSIPSPNYQPSSPGAVPADSAAPTGGFYELPPGTETDEQAAEPPLERRPSTARARSNPASEPVRRAATGEELDNAPTATIRTQPVGAEDRLPLDPGAERTSAIEGLPRQPDPNPFEAVGIRAGSFILRPSIEQGMTATSNASLSNSGSSAILSETTLRLNAVSDWSRHSARLNGYGIFRKSVSGEELKQTEGGIDARLDLEIGNELTGFGELGYSVRPESASSPDAIAGIESQPLTHTFSASTGVEKGVGKARFGITGDVERYVYEDAKLTNGAIVSQEDRNATLATITLRGGYEISPSLTPFVETEFGRRFYDETVDTAGYERSSNRYGARAGLTFDRGEKLSGEFSAGWLRESFDDDRLDPISGPSLNANVQWSPERGTIVRLDGRTTVSGTTTAGESGSIIYDGRLSLERELRANLTGNAALGIVWRDYSGTDIHDLTLSAEAGVTWWLNRYAGISGRVRHEQLSSNQDGRDYDANSVFLGVKLQR